MVEPQQSNMLELKSINKTMANETVNMSQSQVIIKTDQMNKRMMVKKIIPSQKANIIKGNWTPAEDEMLMRMVKPNGMKKWSSTTYMFQVKQCGLGDTRPNHLFPDIKTKPWSEEEDKTIVEVHKIVGNKWSEMAQRLSGRSEDMVKNHWNATERRVLSIKSKSTSALPPRNNTLENYIRRSITSNGGPLMNKEADAMTAKAELDDNSKEDIVDGVMNLNLDARKQTAATVKNPSTTSVYVPEQACSDITVVCEPMDVNP